MHLDPDERLEQLTELLNRLQNHVTLAEAGHLSARDDMAVILHQLVGIGGGYGMLNECLPLTGSDALKFPAWDIALPKELAAPSDPARRIPVIFVLRSPAHDEAVAVDLPTLLKEPCIFYSSNDGAAQEITWGQLIRLTRNKFGAHTDDSPPAWLSEIRFYPAAGADVVSYLLWAISRLILKVVTATLATTGLIFPFVSADNYFMGIDLKIAIVGWDGKTLDCTAHVGCAKWASGDKQAIVGARYDDTPFIFGILGDGRLSLVNGTKGLPLRSLYRHSWKTGKK
jgi:hypothetical protein